MTIVILKYLFTLVFGGVSVSYLYEHPEEAKKWMSMFFELLGKVWKGCNYLAIKYNIESSINSFVNTLNNSSLASFPKVSIKWTGRGGDEVIWEEGKILLIMRDKKNHTKNLVHASQLFVSETLLHKSKAHLSKSQKNSLDLFAVKLILEKTNKGALEYFISHYMIPELNKHDKISDLLKQYVNIEKIGLFFPILIQELVFLGNTIYLETPNAEITTEVKSLVDFLEKFSKREVGDDTAKETFTGKYIRCAIRIMASRFVVEGHKVEGRKQRIVTWIKAGYPNIYILGANKEQTRDFMDSVITAVRKIYPDLKLIKEYQFVAEINKKSGKKQKVGNILIHLHYPTATKYILTKEELEDRMLLLEAGVTEQMITESRD